MNEFLRLERAAKRYKEQYPEGTRIELISMNDSQAVPPGTRGTVDYVDDGAHILITIKQKILILLLKNHIKP